MIPVVAVVIVVADAVAAAPVVAVATAVVAAVVFGVGVATVSGVETEQTAMQGRADV